MSLVTPGSKKSELYLGYGPPIQFDDNQVAFRLRSSYTGSTNSPSFPTPPLIAFRTLEKALGFLGTCLQRSDDGR
ncbi:uncharacterized protein FOMMEDRAFT_141687 [Fomitiporia mediterranea MF3/22]|uniref:uncharacterized protein n=1 Tax=Fomitiporia mediterranea (strain MF3/22) TaxID=694068 RepID=UPI000440879C|nr:uncharacterized protein FOMMEDRAFT_141687 [Fomitiporia mediterranea MF3/22]EJD00918.1 hypothetical protein FOMMEDRAFT_141687 [Fomitiporia mediterranea MF3/22]